MKHIKQIAILTLALFMLVTQFILPASAENTVLANLLPSKDTTKGKLTLTGCTLTENKDGSVTFTLSAATASFKMLLAENVFEEGSGGTIYSGEAFDVTKGAYVVYDYATADNVQLSETKAHYTRKDKAAAKTLADLYLASMEGADYKKYSKSSGKGYGVWDIGSYITVDKKDTGVFDNHLHRFCSFESTFTGKVGAKITFYKFYVSSTSEVKDLGKVRPEPTKFESSTSSKVTSSAASSTSAISSESKATSSAKSESASSLVSSSSSSVSSTSSVKSVSSASSDNGTAEENDDSTLTYILIGVGALAVIGVALYFILKKKK